MALLLASFALGAVFVWSLSNQQLLMPSIAAPDAPVAQLAPLPKRLEITEVDKNKLGSKTVGGVSTIEALEAAKAEASTTQPEGVPVADTPVESGDVSLGDTKKALSPTPAVQAELEQVTFGQVELVGTNITQDATQNETKPTAVVDVKEQTTNTSVKRTEPKAMPIPEPAKTQRDATEPAELTRDSWLLAELAVPDAATTPVTPPVTPPESAFEKLRREELALLAGYSEKLQVDPTSEPLDSTETPQLFQIFDLLFLYSETSVSVTVRSNDTDSTLRNITLAQQRGDRIVDYLVLSGLDRSQFNIIAESSAELPLGSHRIAIQATLDE